MTEIRAIKGTRDILPDEVGAWQRVEATARELFSLYGYREIRTPIFEETGLFARGIGSETDIVAKEMYSFDDRDGSSLTLRPEATAGIVRSVIEQNLANVDPALKVWATGPMFRRERPQKGRQRQFHQVDVEAFGLASPATDVEIIEMALAFLERSGLSKFDLVINSVGDATCRPAYVDELRKVLRANLDRLGPDSRRRTETNPLRVLDSKVPEEQELIASLPRITDYLSPECRDHFDEVRRQLDLLGIRHRVDHRLVRGLDYYVKTTFEVVSGDLGAQNALLGGGRYDGLVAQLGGPNLCGIGFAVGVERLVMLVGEGPTQPRCDVFLVPLGAPAQDPALLLQRQLRMAGVRSMMDTEGRSFKARMKMADKLGARLVLILGEDEIKKGVWSVRDMAASQQQDVPEGRLLEHLKERING